MTSPADTARGGSPEADMKAVWSAAIDAVRPDLLVASRLLVEKGELLVEGRPLDPPVFLDCVGRILVVGGGKAAAGLAAALESLLGGDSAAAHRLSGLVSVPEGCGRSLRSIAVRETRPAAANLPTERVVACAREILGRISSLSPTDLAIAIVTGGGSALLAAPRDGVTLDEKIAATRRLSEAGATIAELNAVRRSMSMVKGGGLARACSAGRLLVLALSDVIGSDLDVIASGPCMPGDGSAADGRWTTAQGCMVEHLILGDNATAVHAAARTAGSLGYEIVVREGSVASSRESAEDVGRRLAAEGLALIEAVRRDGCPRAIIEGGEAIVRVPADHGAGGRNQQTVLAAIDAATSSGGWPTGLAIASVGTDGEDGPTDAAGGLADSSIVEAIHSLGLDVRGALARCDAHPLLAASGGLIRTGPTGTNVADVRVVLAR